MIDCIFDGNSWINGNDQVMNHFLQVFDAQFSPEVPPHHQQHVVNCLEPWNKLVSVSEIQQLALPFKPVEVHAAMFLLGPTKAPGPDGIPVRISGTYIVQNKVIHSVLSFLSSGFLLRKANYKTFIALANSKSGSSTICIGLSSD